jgi:hypothetical protein
MLMPLFIQSVEVGGLDPTALKLHSNSNKCNAILFPTVSYIKNV